MKIEDIGLRIRRQRQKLGFTQEGLARLLNVSSQAVSKWERGRNAPDITLLPSLAAALDQTVDQLLGHEIRSPHMIEGSILAGHLMIGMRQLREIDTAAIAFHVNYFCTRFTELVKHRNGLPLSYANGDLLCAFTGAEHRARALDAAAECVHLRIGKIPYTAGLSAGPVFIGSIGHPDHTNVTALGPVVREAFFAASWAERNAASRLVATKGFSGITGCGSFLKGPEQTRIENEKIELFEVDAESFVKNRPGLSVWPDMA